MKKVGLLVLILAILIVFSGLLYSVFNKNIEEYEKPSEKNKQPQFVLEDFKTVKICYDNKKCGLEDTKFSILEFPTSVKEVNEKIESINQDTEKYYELVNSSSLDSPECIAASEVYQKRKYVLTNYQLYHDEFVISIAVNRTIKDLCTDSYETLPYDVFVYDKVNKVVLTPSELLTRVGYTEEMVKQSIIDSVENLNSVGDYAISMENVFINGQPNYSLFYNEDGFLVLAYQIKNLDSFSYEEIILGT